MKMKPLPRYFCRYTDPFSLCETMSCSVCPIANFCCEYAQCGYCNPFSCDKKPNKITPEQRAERRKAMEQFELGIEV